MLLTKAVDSSSTDASAKQGKEARTHMRGKGKEDILDSNWTPSLISKEAA
jgi:hypothetical protein